LHLSFILHVQDQQFLKKESLNLEISDSHVQEKINHEMVEEIFQDQKIVDHVNHYLNQPIYDIFEVEQIPFVGYEEEKVYFQ
jgi:hypothetical protein